MKGLEMPHFFSPRVLRTLKWILVLLAALAILLLIGGSLLSSYISDKVRSRFEDAGGKFEDLEVNLFTQSIAVQDIEFIDNGDSDSVVATTAKVESIVLKNISIYQLVAKKALSMADVVITEGDVVINRALLVEDSGSNNDEEALLRIGIDRIKFSNVAVSVVNDTSKEFSGIINGTLTGIKSSDSAGVGKLSSYTLQDVDISMTKLVISSPQYYSIEIASVDASSRANKLVIDSLHLIPKYTKYDFARVVGKQTDRINTLIPQISIDGLQYAKATDSALVASKITIASGEVHSFRDKREPFRETEVKPLPIAALKSLNFGLEVDTIEIKGLKVTYEEFAPEGFEAGTVVFEDLNATLTNVRNRNEVDKPEYATLKASAKLMGEGLIDATFQLPYREGDPYLAEGKIGKMSLDFLNPPLQNLAFIQIQSGTLQGLAFNFSYTDIASTGRVTINYENLKIEGLKKEKSTVINDLKTFLINTVIKNDKDKEVPIEKRTGKVDFERDRKRQIFNYWWKSLFSGIKSSVMDS
jgi:hypothetical protein